MFISIEGGEGAGKSTLIRGLEAKLENVLVTREPGGTELGEALRNLLLSVENAVLISAQAEMLLMLAARAEHLEELIRPALAKGKTVICDRFNHSTVAYQGGGRGLGVDYVQEACELVCQGTLPDIIFYLDIDVKEGLKRTKKLDKEHATSGKGDRIESETLAFHQIIRDTFLELANKDPRIIIIDATQSIEEVLQIAYEALNRQHTS